MRPILIAVFAAMAFASSASAREPSPACMAAAQALFYVFAAHSAGEDSMKAYMDIQVENPEVIARAERQIADTFPPGDAAICHMILRMEAESLEVKRGVDDAIRRQRGQPKAQSNGEPDDPGTILDQVQKQQADEGRLTTILRNVERLKDAPPTP